MIVESHEENVECLICDTIEDYNKYVCESSIKDELHRLSIVKQVGHEDMGFENNSYGNIIRLNRVCAHTC